MTLSLHEAVTLGNSQIRVTFAFFFGNLWCSLKCVQFNLLQVISTHKFYTHIFQVGHILLEKQHSNNDVENHIVQNTNEKLKLCKQLCMSTFESVTCVLVV